MPKYTPRLLAALSLCLPAVFGLGCGTAPAERLSHAPTYSYLNDAEARAEIDLWPAVPGDSRSLIAARIDTEEE